MKTAFLVLLCVLVALTTVTDARRKKRSARLRLKASPRVVAAGISEELTLDCRPPGSVDDVLWAFLLIVDFENVNGTISHLAQQTSETQIIDETNRTTAEGYNQMSQDDELSFLTVTVEDPSEEDEGVYSCRFIYLDLDYQVKTLSASVNVTVKVVPEGVEYIPPPPVSEGCDCDAIWDEINNIKSTLAEDNARLRTEVQGHDDSCRVSFAARFQKRSGYTLQSEAPVVFDAIISNKGSAYNTNNGEFIAPCAGQYFFALTVRSFQTMDSGYVEGIIMRDGKPEARTSVFLDHDGDNYQSASTDVVLTLAQGEKVNVQLRTTSSGEFVGEDYTIFSGFFLYP
ncbi:uncharacterized protein LOC101850618 [Aplysia californica]|uniref:Uncharacterized protein LOC101850618 n=1 Tax=Aplysia californica TaxID=6500 RepID=A0ABM1ADR1_APLCA|nr:uncharacterized protein LOC101850618 [Aplysia californica]